MKLKVILLLSLLSLGACQSAYYSAAEKVGYEKRDILVDRVESSRDAQADAEKEFKSALEQLTSLVNFDGGELADAYAKMSDEYDEAVSAADEVHDRISAVENVSEALFREWEEEIDLYSSARLKADSQQKLRETRKRYKEMIAALKKSEEKMAPVLAALNDNVLYLKHNLNARAVASLELEFKSIESDIGELIADLRRAIATSDEFIASMKEG